MLSAMLVDTHQFMNQLINLSGTTGGAEAQLELDNRLPYYDSCVQEYGAGCVTPTATRCANTGLQE